MNQVTIRIDSWHYKLVKKYYKPAPSFCNYFWQVVWSVIRNTYLWVIPLLVLFINGWRQMIYYETADITIFGFFSVLTSVIGSALIVIILLLAVAFYLSEKVKNLEKKMDVWAASLSVAISLKLKTIKGKYCPKIKYVK